LKAATALAQAALDLLAAEGELIASNYELNPYWAPEADVEDFDDDELKEEVAGLPRDEAIGSVVTRWFNRFDDVWWAPDGRPRLRAIEKFGEHLEGVTRDEVEAVLPGYTRNGTRQ
jgi:hypothetical protein